MTPTISTLHLSRAVRAALRAACFELVPSATHCEVGLRESAPNRLTANALLWTEDADLGDMCMLRALNEVEVRAEDAAYRLDVYVYGYAAASEVELLTNVYVSVAADGQITASLRPWL